MAEQIVMRLERGGCALCDAPTQPDGAGIIKGSVGRGGRNNPDDVKAIQAALNAQDVADGGPSPKLAVDGIAGPLTTAAIEKYQRRHLGWADGRALAQTPRPVPLARLDLAGVLPPPPGGRPPVAAADRLAVLAALAAVRTLGEQGWSATQLTL